MRSKRSLRFWLAIGGTVVLWACQSERLLESSRPEGPPSGLDGISIRLEVNLRDSSIRIVAPVTSPSSGAEGITPAFAILGANEVGVATANLTRTTIPGNKVRVSFDAAITNRLTSSSLVPPTFPAGAAGSTGLLLFPYRVTQVVGAAASQVLASLDWNGDGTAGSGAPRNFFNDFGCPGSGITSDCLRWEQYPAPLFPGETTPAQRVGFDVPKAVTSFQVLLVLAADINNDLPAPQRLVVTPPSYVMNDGFPANFSAVAYDAQNNPLPWVTIHWASPDITAVEFQYGSALVGSITGPSVVVHGRKVGQTFITARTGGLNVTVPIDIQVNTIVLVQLYTHPDSDLVVGEQVQGDVRIKDNSGNIVPGFVATWSTSDPNVATVDANGLITAMGPGSVTITATAAAASGSVPLTVTAASTGNIAGRMLDLGGHPVAGTNVFAFGPSPSLTTFTATTAADGSYSFGGTLTAGAYIINWSPIGCVSNSGVTPVTAGATSTFDITVDCPPRVQGQLTRQQPGALPIGLTVELTPDLGGPDIVVPVESDGSYSSPGFPAGGYYIAVKNVPTACVAFGGQSISLTQQTLFQKPFSLDCPQGFWTTRAPMPTARTALAAGVINGILYAVGGYDDNQTTRLGSLEAYDPATNSWTMKAPMHYPRSALAAAAINGILYVVGGDQSGSVIEAYDPSTDTWTTKTQAPTAHQYGAAAAVNGILYVMGDFTSPGNVVEAYDPATDSWTTKASIPTGRYQFTLTELGGLLYAVGGAGTVSGGATTTVDVYDPSTDTWSPRAPMPAYGGQVAGVIGGLLYVAAYNALYTYDPATDSWSTLPAVPPFTSRPAGGAVNGALFQVGGDLTLNPFTVSRALYAFQP